QDQLSPPQARIHSGRPADRSRVKRIAASARLPFANVQETDNSHARQSADTTIPAQVFQVAGGAVGSSVVMDAGLAGRFTVATQISRGPSSESLRPARVTG